MNFSFHLLPWTFYIVAVSNFLLAWILFVQIAILFSSFLSFELFSSNSEQSVNKEILSVQFQVDVNVENYFAIKKHFKAIIFVPLTLIRLLSSTPAVAIQKSGKQKRTWKEKIESNFIHINVGKVRERN